MCLIISIIFTALAYTFFEDGNMQGFYINIYIAIFFILLMIRNIIKTKNEKKS
jgi:hypothetical protein